MPFASMPVAKLRALLRSWALALALSAGLVAAGDRWSEPLVINPVLVWCLVALPPALMAAVLLLRWQLLRRQWPPPQPAAAEGRESGDRAQGMG